MAHGDRCVHVTLVQHVGKRPSHDVAAADDDAVRAGSLEAASLDEFDDTCGCAGEETNFTDADEADVERMEAVHVFFRED
jgi:hypothetical protein